MLKNNRWNIYNNFTFLCQRSTLKGKRYFARAKKEN